MEAAGVLAYIREGIERTDSAPSKTWLVRWGFKDLIVGKSELSETDFLPPLRFRQLWQAAVQGFLLACHNSRMHSSITPMHPQGSVTSGNWMDLGTLLHWLCCWIASRASSVPQAAMRSTMTQQHCPSRVP